MGRTKTARESAVLHGRDPYDELFDGMADASAYISDFRFSHPSDVFDFAWAAGGIAQNSGRRMSYVRAVNGARR